MNHYWKKAVGHVMLALMVLAFMAVPGFSEGTGAVKILTQSSPDISIQAGESVKLYGCQGTNRIDIGSGSHVKMLHMQGGNIINIDADSSIFIVSRSGAMVTFQGTDGTLVKIPASQTGQLIVFKDGQRFLAIQNNEVLLGQQQVSLIPSEVKPLGNEGEEFTNRFGMKFVKIPAGSFMMGSDDNDPDAYSDEKPQHEVTLTKDFYMQTTEVTQGQWKSVMGSNPSWFQGERAPAGVNPDNLPVEWVSWGDAQEFIVKLNEKTGETYSLPSEAQWEYAARGDVGNQKYSGSDDPDEVAWHYDNSGYTIHEVAAKAPNAWGLYDMSGNVWEWCQDHHHHRGYNGAPADGSVWKGSEWNDRRVIRGGAWYYSADRLRPAYRGGSSYGDRGSIIGFRLVRMP